MRHLCLDKSASGVQEHLKAGADLRLCQDFRLNHICVFSFPIKDFGWCIRPISFCGQNAEGVSLERYRIYSYMLRCGFIVKR